MLMASALIMGVALSPLSVNAADSTTSDTQQVQKKQKNGQNKMQKQFRKMAKYLQLTEAQKTEIKSIRESLQADKDIQRGQMQAYKVQLKALVAEGNFTDSSFEALYDSYQDTFKQKELNQAKMKNAVFQVLTDEQKVKWQTFHAQNQGKGKNKGQGKNRG